MREQLAKKSKEMEMVKMQKSKPRNKKLQNQQTKRQTTNVDVQVCK